MIDTRKVMDLMDNQKNKLLGIKLMKKIAEELDVDFVSAMKTEFEPDIDTGDG